MRVPIASGVVAGIHAAGAAHRPTITIVTDWTIRSPAATLNGRGKATGRT